MDISSNLKGTQKYHIKKPTSVSVQRLQELYGERGRRPAWLRSAPKTLTCTATTRVEVYDSKIPRKSTTTTLVLDFLNNDRACYLKAEDVAQGMRNSNLVVRVAAQVECYSPDMVIVKWDTPFARGGQVSVTVSWSEQEHQDAKKQKVCTTNSTSGGRSNNVDITSMKAAEMGLLNHVLAMVWTAVAADWGVLGRETVVPVGTSGWWDKIQECMDSVDVKGGVRMQWDKYVGKVSKTGSEVEGMMVAMKNGRKRRRWEINQWILAEKVEVEKEEEEEEEVTIVEENSVDYEEEDTNDILEILPVVNMDHDEDIIEHLYSDDIQVTFVETHDSEYEFLV